MTTPLIILEIFDCKTLDIQELLGAKPICLFSHQDQQAQLVQMKPLE
jgi:hypothetical protein